MYKSNIAIYTINKKALLVLLNDFLKPHKKIHCKALKRKVSLEKLPEAIVKRKLSATRRLQCFFVAIDILKNENRYAVRKNKGCFEYEIKGSDRNGVKVTIHIREEIDNHKNKALFFLSCYY